MTTGLYISTITITVPPSHRHPRCFEIISLVMVSYRPKNNPKGSLSWILPLGAPGCPPSSFHQPYRVATDVNFNNLVALGLVACGDVTGAHGVLRGRVAVATEFGIVNCNWMLDIQNIVYYRTCRIVFNVEYRKFFFFQLKRIQMSRF